MPSRGELDAIFDAFLIGLGIGESREEVRVATVQGFRGSATTWGIILQQYVTVTLGPTAGGPKPLGAFVRWCLEQGYIRLETLPARRLSFPDPEPGLDPQLGPRRLP